jgi:hypothetical protein
MAGDDAIGREMWLAVARAAAEHRRVVGAGDAVFYGDLTLRGSADARAWGELIGAIRSALDGAAGEGEIVDALVSGDPRLDVSEAAELIEWARTREQRLRDLNAKILRDVLGED